MTNPPEIIRLFALCEAMRWTHLPVAGGLYDQSPDFIDGINLIFAARAKKDKAKHDKAEFERRQQANNASSRRPKR